MPPPIESNQNVVLIGMPGVGKSTIGVLLAEALAYSFLDSDIYIQTQTQKRLQEIIDAEGLDGFCAIEAQIVAAISCRSHVIATGGSVVYSQTAMTHLKSNGICVHLDLDPEKLETRLANLATRGVVMASGQSIRSLYAERLPLYRRYADVTVDCRDHSADHVVDTIVDALRRLGKCIPVTGPA
jgi:shikimate kinase